MHEGRIIDLALKPGMRCSRDEMLRLKIRNGKILVTAGLVTSILGIFDYCMNLFSAASAPGASLPWATNPFLMIGIGVLMWLIGAIKYLGAAIDAHIPDEDAF